MSYVTVEVDVDLDEIDTEDLVEEFCRRMKNISGRKALTKDQKERFKKEYEALQGVVFEGSINIPGFHVVRISNLEQKEKLLNFLKQEMFPFLNEQVEANSSLFAIH
jgi:hypothetical protein